MKVANFLNIKVLLLFKDYLGLFYEIYKMVQNWRSETLTSCWYWCYFNNSKSFTNGSKYFL